MRRKQRHELSRAHIDTTRRFAERFLDFTLYINSRRRAARLPREGRRLGGGGGGGGTRQRPTNPVYTQKSVHERQQREISVTYPRPGLLRARGLDEGRRRAHEGAHGELRVPRAFVREALWAALVDVREVSREHEDLRW